MQLQISVVDHLKIRARPEIVWHHTPNGELRDKRTAAKLKAMGTLAGVADLTFVFPVRHPVVYLELKARGGKLTEAQCKFRDRVRALGHVYEWTDSIDDAIRILRKHLIIYR